MIEQTSCKRLILRAVLRHVSPMVIRLVSVSDQLDLPEFNDIFCAILGWSGDLGYLIRVHGQEFNSFHRKTRSKALHEFRLHRQEKFLYVCDTLYTPGKDLCWIVTLGCDRLRPHSPFAGIRGNGAENSLNGITYSFPAGSGRV
jgi:hypothetical protein